MDTIEKQVQLPWGKSVRMAFTGIRIEFRRSILTALSIVFALAFLSFIWTDADVIGSLRNAATGDPLLKRRLQISGQLTENPSQTQRKTLLVAMSLIVCTVGISNAMAMSVTERFQVIGTMKCLGALNSFIARLFVLEAMFLGLAGTVIGDVTGVALAVIRGLLGYGGVVLIHFPWTDLAATCAYSLLVGAGISLLGALYPAIIAARMEPVEAMRVTA